MLATYCVFVVNSLCMLILKEVNRRLSKGVFTGILCDGTNGPRNNLGEVRF